MMDQLIAIKDKLLAFWNKYTTKQKTIVISVVLAVFFAVVILSYVLTRPVYTHLASFSDASLASTLSEALDGKGITYKMETDPSIVCLCSIQQISFCIYDNNIICCCISYRICQIKGHCRSCLCWQFLSIRQFQRSANRRLFGR